MVAYVPPVCQNLVDEITGRGVTFYPYPLDRTSTNPLRDWKSYTALKERMALDRPEVVFSYTAKPMIYGSLAASRNGVGRIVSLVTGLGYGFSGVNLKQRVLSSLQRLLYRFALRRNARVVFQNPDDRELFVRWGLVSEQQSEVVAGSGINVEDYSFHPLPSEGPRVFLMVARLLREKGVLEYMEAARRVEEQHPGECRYLLVGGEDGNPGGLKIDRLREMDSPVELLGHHPDVKSYLQDCHCFVLPSYREGTPRSTLEALAVGRPVVTTDAVGCRETVTPGENGWMLQVGNTEGLAKAMGEVAVLPREQLEQLARASRNRAEEVFDVRKVNQQMVGWIVGPNSEIS